MNKHTNKKYDNEKLDEKVLKKGFEAGVTMAFLSMGKFEKEEDNDKLKQINEKLYSEFISILKHSKNDSEELIDG